MKINDEDVTFRTLLEKFYEKAASKGMILKPKLDFMLQISDHVLITQFQTPVEFLDETKHRAVGRRISKKIKEFNKRHTRKIQHIIAKICSFMAFNSPNKYDDFINAFKKWEDRPVDVKQLQQIKTVLNCMEEEFKKLKDKFKNYTDTAVRVKKNIQLDLGFAKSLLNNISKTKRSAVKASMKKELKPIVERLLHQQIKLIATLRNVILILFSYNEQRIIWAEFLIGMRNSPNVDCKSAIDFKQST